MSAQRSPATLALEAVLALLGDAGITAGRDPGAFHAAPLGVLVGLPSLADATLAARVYDVPIYVVSSDPLTGPANVDALYALADDVAFTVRADNYAPTDWSGGTNQEPLPAVQMSARATVPVPVVTPGGTDEHTT